MRTCAHDKGRSITHVIRADLPSGKIPDIEPLLENPFQKGYIPVHDYLSERHLREFQLFDIFFPEGFVQSCQE